MAEIPAPSANNEYREIVKTFVGERLRRSGIFVSGYDVDESHEDPITEIASTLRRVGDELESANADFFGQMGNQLQINQFNAFVTFQGISDEIFLSGKNWGRIVAFLTFGSTFAIHCASRPELGPSYVDRIVNWIAKYMESHLDVWMRQHGSWEGFLDFFEKVEPSSDNGATNQNGFLVSALAGLGIGALLMISFK